MSSGMRELAGGESARPGHLERASQWLRAAGRILVRPDARVDAVYEWRRRLRGAAAPLPVEVRSVLVLCHGNICRSPYAERLLADRLPGVRVRSAGLAADDDRPADADAVRAAMRRGVSLASHRSRRLRPEDVRAADLVLGMEGRHLHGLVRQVDPARGFLLGEFLPDAPHTIPDPWGRPDAFFDAVFARIEIATEALARRLRGETS